MLFHQWPYIPFSKGGQPQKKLSLGDDQIEGDKPKAAEFPDFFIEKAMDMIILNYCVFMR
jgi:hypothetical protein